MNNYFLLLIILAIFALLISNLNTKPNEPFLSRIRKGIKHPHRRPRLSRSYYYGPKSYHWYYSWWPSTTHRPPYSPACYDWAKEKCQGAYHTLDCFNYWYGHCVGYY